MRTVAGLALLVAGSAAAERVSFRHRTHLKGKPPCTSCHPVEQSDLLRPAGENHAACDGADCHAREFYLKPVADNGLCLTCHLDTSWEELEKREQNLRPFPRGRDRAAQSAAADRSYLDGWDFYAEFNHQAHLKDGGPVKAKTGPELEAACLYCHQVALEGNDAVVVRPGHEHCQNCHDGQSGPKSSMKDCASCHLYRRSEAGRLLKTGPEPRHKLGRVTGRFSHEKHRLDRRKKQPVPVSCGACHPQAAEAKRLAEIVPTAGERTMERSCAQCHDGRQRSAAGKPIFSISGKCTLCHEARFFEDDALPASHRKAP